MWAYVSLDNVMDSITLHSSSMFIDLAQSLRWNPAKSSRAALLSHDGQCASLRAQPLAAGGEESCGQATVIGMREYNRTEVWGWGANQGDLLGRTYHGAVSRREAVGMGVAEGPSNGTVS